MEEEPIDWDIEIYVQEKPPYKQDPADDEEKQNQAYRKEVLRKAAKQEMTGKEKLEIIKGYKKGEALNE
ncbi:MAG: hypothetical protein HWN65_03510 [Candidatus Helarchaeota archaeon]|nr:hypothetical protein [Candidatus Helarchaeota archaeon]